MPWLLNESYLSNRESQQELPGTYYIVASSTEADWDVVLNAEELPCPDEITAEANCVAPLDDEDGLDPSSVTLKWHLSPYTTEYRLLFGSTYYCENVLVDWTRDLAESYTVRNLFNNTNYFWRIEERNDGCPQGIQGPVWGFTTTFNAPSTSLHRLPITLTSYLTLLQILIVSKI